MKEQFPIIEIVLNNKNSHRIFTTIQFSHKTQTLSTLDFNVPMHCGGISALHERRPRSIPAKTIGARLRAPFALRKVQATRQGQKSGSSPRRSRGIIFLAIPEQVLMRVSLRVARAVRFKDVNRSFQERIPFPLRTFACLMKSAVFTIVSHSRRAESVVSELRLAGFSSEDVSVLFSDMKETRDFAHTEISRTREGAPIDGLLMGLGTFFVPKVGVLVAAGPVVAALNGVAGDATTTGLSGVLVGLGFAESEAKFYAKRLDQGNILIAVHTGDSDKIKAVREIFERADALEIGVTHEPSAAIHG